MNFNLIQKRMERGLTQKKVAEAIGISAMAVGLYEKGLRVPRPEIKKKLANFYGCEESELFGKAQSDKADFKALEQAAMPLYETMARRKEEESNNLKDFINIELLENYYLGLIHKNGYNKCLVSVELTEKLMLLEIYKALCLGRDSANNNADNTNNDSDD